MLGGCNCNGVGNGVNMCAMFQQFFFLTADSDGGKDWDWDAPIEN